MVISARLVTSLATQGSEIVAQEGFSEIVNRIVSYTLRASHEGGHVNKQTDHLRTSTMIRAPTLYFRQWYVSDAEVEKGFCKVRPFKDLETKIRIKSDAGARRYPGG